MLSEPFKNLRVRVVAMSGGLLAILTANVVAASPSPGVATPTRTPKSLQVDDTQVALYLQSMGLDAAPEEIARWRQLSQPEVIAKLKNLGIELSATDQGKEEKELLDAVVRALRPSTPAEPVVATPKEIASEKISDSQFDVVASKQAEMIKEAEAKGSQDDSTIFSGRLISPDGAAQIIAYAVKPDGNILGDPEGLYPVAVAHSRPDGSFSMIRYQSRAQY